MKLILMRHAKSDWSSFDQPDKARLLNQRGERSAVALGAWLKAKGYLPDQVLCSSAARTRQTLDLLALNAPVHFDDRLYLASADMMDLCLSDAIAETVLMIGHNPGIAEFASQLVTKPVAHTGFHEFPTCATLVVDFPGQSAESLRPGTGQAIDFIVPRELMA